MMINQNIMPILIGAGILAGFVVGFIIGVLAIGKDR